MTLAATLFVVLIGALGLFQLLLAAGAPLGHFAWGGQHRVLPTGFRIGSLIAILLYGLFAVIVLDRIGVLSVIPETWADDLIWVLIAYFAIGVFVNLMSRSLPERLVMTPLALILTILTWIVAVNS